MSKKYFALFSVAFSFLFFPILAEHNKNALADDELAMRFRVPDDSTIPAGAQGAKIRRGLQIVTHTKRELPDYVGSSLRCNNCHLKAGTVPYAAPWVGVTRRYPRFSSRSANNVTLQQRIQGCFQRSLNGKPLPVDSEPMQAIIAYMEWLSQYIPPGATVEGRGIPNLLEPLTPDRKNGEKLFMLRCSICHGEDGHGQLNAEPQRYPYGFPPLWGNESFNVAAGMARLHKAASFIKKKCRWPPAALFPTRRPMMLPTLLFTSHGRTFPARKETGPPAANQAMPAIK
jgi:thiosulfate dehydrogenase